MLFVSASWGVSIGNKSNTQQSWFLQKENDNRIDDQLKQDNNLPKKYYLDSEKEYDWISIESSALSLGDDDSYMYDLPFVFPFFDAVFSKIYISSNGYVSFIDQNPVFQENTFFPTSYPLLHYCIALFWSDLKPADSIYITATNNFVAIIYDSVPYFGIYGIAGTFELILFKNGDIKFQYQFINPKEYNPPTAGINFGPNPDYYNSIDLYSMRNQNNFAFYFTARIPNWIWWTIGGSSFVLVLTITLLTIFVVIPKIRLKRIQDALDSLEDKEGFGTFDDGCTFQTELEEEEHDDEIESKTFEELLADEILAIYKSMKKGDILLLEPLSVLFECEIEEVEKVLLDLQKKKKIKGFYNTFTQSFKVKVEN
jgi:hypothetical protein